MTSVPEDEDEDHFSIFVLELFKKTNGGEPTKIRPILNNDKLFFTGNDQRPRG